LRNVSAASGPVWPGGRPRARVTRVLRVTRYGSAAIWILITIVPRLSHRPANRILYSDPIMIHNIARTHCCPRRRLRAVRRSYRYVIHVLRIGQVCLVCTRNRYIIMCPVSRIGRWLIHLLKMVTDLWRDFEVGANTCALTHTHTHTHARSRERIECACVRAYMLCGQRDKNEYPERSVNTTHNGQPCCLPTFEKPSWVTLIENTSLVIV